MSVKITKEELKDGSVRWRARGVSTGRDPVTGSRTQRTISGATKGEVEREVRKIGVAVDRGTYTKPWMARSTRCATPGCAPRPGARS